VSAAIDDFDVEDYQAVSEVEPQSSHVVNPAPILDLSMVDPNKVNWFKYIVDKYLTQANSVLNSTDAYANLLQILLSRKSDAEIQEDLLDLVGFENIELMTELMEKRDFIK
jgi:hypothetical protein